MGAARLKGQRAHPQKCCTGSILGKFRARPTPRAYPPYTMSPSAAIPSSWSRPQTPHTRSTTQATLRDFLCDAGAGFTVIFLNEYSRQCGHACERAMKAARSFEMARRMGDIR